MLGSQLGKLYLKKLLGGGVVQDFPGHGIDLVGHEIAIGLGDFPEGRALAEKRRMIL